jgi:histidyl-tRNA synthetase
LEKFGCLPAPEDLLSPPVLVTVFDEKTKMQAFQLAAELREGGITVAVYPSTDKLRKQLKYADRIGSRIVIITGPDEVAQNQVTVKDLRKRTQHTLPRREAGAFIRTLTS